MMLTCRDVSEKATDYMEGALPPTNQLRVWTHLRLCPACRRYLQQLGAAIGLARSAASEPPPAEVEENLVNLFRKAKGGAAD